MRLVLIKMIKIILIYIASLLPFENGLVVRPHDLESIESTSQHVVTVFFEVTNNSLVHQNLIEEVNLPEKWEIITKSFPFTIDYDELVIRLVSFYIPEKPIKTEC